MEELKKYLNGLGACDLRNEVDSLEAAVSMMFTPQGREFCMKTGFPTLDFLRKHREALNAIPGVFIDCGDIPVNSLDSTIPNLLIIGDSRANLNVSKPTILYHVIAAHNASLTLYAKDYAVVTITRVGDAKIEVVNDGTANVNTEG